MHLYNCNNSILQVLIHIITAPQSSQPNTGIIKIVEDSFFIYGLLNQYICLLSS